jgi:microcystin-dependent protein
MKKFKNNNNKNLFVVVAFNSLTFLSTLSFAEDGFNSCNALLQAGIYNTSQTDNANDSELLRKSSFCAYDYSKVQESSAQATSIQASYGLFDGGVKHQATKSEIVEKQTSVCQNVFGSEKYSSKASSFARNVYQGSLDAWNRCQSLQQKGVNFDLQTSQNLQGVTLELSTSSIGSTVNFNGLDQIGLGRSICTTTRNASNGSSTGKVLTVDKTTSLKFNSSSKLAITCERQMSGDGKGGLYADAQTLVFNTSAGSYQVPMVAIALAPRIPVEEAVAKLESSVNSQINNLKIVGQVITIATPYCPDGYIPADGKVYKASDLQRLFNAIGYSHGGSGEFFNVPDYRGRFLRGVDNDANNDPDKNSRIAMNTGGNIGNKIGSLQLDMFKSHTHNLSNTVSGHTGTANDNKNNVNAVDRYGLIQNVTALPSGGNETRPKNAYVNFCIGTGL